MIGEEIAQNAKCHQTKGKFVVNGLMTDVRIRNACCQTRKLFKASQRRVNCVSVRLVSVHLCVRSLGSPRVRPRTTPTCVGISFVKFALLVHCCFRSFPVTQLVSNASSFISFQFYDRMSAPLTYKGTAHFRQRLVLSTLSGRPIIIEEIRSGEENPGLRGFVLSRNSLASCAYTAVDYEVSFLQLLGKISNGAKTNINVTGMSPTVSLCVVTKVHHRYDAYVSTR